MPLTLAEKIKIATSRRGITLSELAVKTEQSKQNMSNKMKRDNFTEKEMIEICKALNCTFETRIIMNDTGEEI